MGLDSQGYFSLKEILGYNAQYNIVLSDRGRGKSYGTKLFLMKQEGCSMCLYRSTVDLESARQEWCDTLYENGYGAEQFAWEGSQKEGWVLCYNGKKKVWFRAISQVNHIKQEKFPDDMNWVWLDEFIPLVYRKLPGVQSEGDAIRTIVKTIDHDSVRSREEKGLKPLRVLMFANPFTWDNPILRYFKVNPVYGYGVHRAGPGVVYEILPPIEKKEGGKMTVDDFLGDEVNKNQGWMNQDAFVYSVPKGATPKKSMRFGTEFYVMYESNGKWYVRKEDRHKIIYGATYASRKPVEIKYGTLDGLQEDEFCLDSSHAKRMLDMCEQGLIYFHDMNTKFGFINAVLGL